MTRLVLKRPHTHAGMAFQAGDRIDVDATTADWLMAHGVAAPDVVPPKVDPEPRSLHRKEPKP